jgi:hypothetical protein
MRKCARQTSESTTLFDVVNVDFTLSAYPKAKLPATVFQTLRAADRLRTHPEQNKDFIVEFIEPVLQPLVNELVRKYLLVLKIQSCSTLRHKPRWKMEVESPVKGVSQT